MTTAEQPKQIMGSTKVETPLTKKEQSPPKGKTLKRSFGRLRGLRLRIREALLCRKQRHCDDADSSTASPGDMKRFDGNDPTSILGVSFAHPAFLLQSAVEDEPEMQNVRVPPRVPVQQRSNKLNLTNTIVETMAVDSWGSETSSYPSDEESTGGYTLDFSDDEAPFDEMDERPAFDTNSVVDSDSRAHRLIEIGDIDRGVHYFYKDDDSDVASLPWIEQLGSSGALEFRPETLCSMLDASSLLQQY